MLTGGAVLGQCCHSASEPAMIAVHRLPDVGRKSSPTDGFLIPHRAVVDANLTVKHRDCDTNSEL
jgi:hypothetical protein